VKNVHAVSLGSLGGLKGGPARARSLTPERRSEIAKLGAESRWRSERRRLAAEISRVEGALKERGR